MNKYILSALVVPVAFMGTTAAQAKTAVLKAKVNQANASAKKITGKTVRGAHIKLTRGTVTYGVAKADRHGHFVLKLKHKVKGGWKYKVTISKAGYKNKSIGFKVQGLTKKTAKIKPVVPTTPAPTTPAAPQAPAAQSSAPKPTTVGSQADVEAGKVSNDIARLNLQMDNFQSGRQTMTPFWRTSIESQVQQLLNRINGLATGNLRTDLLNTLRNAWTNLHQRFLNFVAGLNRQVFGGSVPAKSVKSTTVQKVVNRADPTAVANEISRLEELNKQNNRIVNELTNSFEQTSKDFSLSESQNDNKLKQLNEDTQKAASDFENASFSNPSLTRLKSKWEFLSKVYNRQIEVNNDEKRDHKEVLVKLQNNLDVVREQISKNNMQIQSLQDLQKQASQTK